MDIQNVTATYAGFWKRLGAYFIDVIILMVIGFIVGLIIGTVLKDDSNKAQISAGAVSAIIGWLYYALQESSDNQATIGKQTLGIKVTDMNGNRISFMQATARHFSKILSSLIIGIGYLMIFFTEKKQGLHDIIAKTLVVNK